MVTKKEELEQKIKVLTESDMLEDAEKYKAQLAALEGGSTAPAPVSTGGFELPVTEDDYNAAGSKFIILPPGRKEVYLDVDIGMVAWSTPGKSMKLPVTVTEDGINHDKSEVLHFGVTPSSIWKAKDIYKSITGQDMPFRNDASGVKRPVIDPMILFGCKAVGYWVETEGRKGGDPNGEIVNYPKLVNIFPHGSKPTSDDLGI